MCSLALCEHWWWTACEADLHACIASVPEPKTTGHVYLVTPGRCPWLTGQTQGPQRFRLLLLVSMLKDTLNFNSPLSQKNSHKQQHTSFKTNTTNTHSHTHKPDLPQNGVCMAITCPFYKSPPVSVSPACLKMPYHPHICLSFLGQTGDLLCVFIPSVLIRDLNDSGLFLGFILGLFFLSFCSLD